MATECINVYMNNPTEGAKDGTCVSNGTFTAPIKLNFSGDHSGATRQKVKLAIRTEEGFKTVGETIIRANDAINPRYPRGFLSWTEEGEFRLEISTTDAITETNKIFYLLGTAHDGEFEEAGLDKSLSLEVLYLIKKI